MYPVYLVKNGVLLLAAFTDQECAIAWAESAAVVAERTNTRATIHYVIEKWRTNATDWRDDIHVYGDGKIVPQTV